MFVAYILVTKERFFDCFTGFSYLNTNSKGHYYFALTSKQEGLDKIINLTHMAQFRTICQVIPTICLIELPVLFN